MLEWRHGFPRPSGKSGFQKLESTHDGLQMVSLCLASKTDFDRNSPLGPSGLLARLPGSRGKGLAARDPCGVPPRETEVGGLSFSFLILPPSVISAPDPAPVSTSLPDPAPPGMFRTRFLP